MRKLLHIRSYYMQFAHLTRRLVRLQSFWKLPRKQSVYELLSQALWSLQNRTTSGFWTRGRSNEPRGGGECRLGRSGSSCHVEVVMLKLSAKAIGRWWSFFGYRSQIRMFFFPPSKPCKLQTDCEGTYISFQVVLLLLLPKRCSVVVWDAQPCW